MSLILIEA